MPAYGNYFPVYFQYLGNMGETTGVCSEERKKFRKGEENSAAAAFPGDVKIFPAVKNGTGILMIIPA
jgi:hypothetical protein